MQRDTRDVRQVVVDLTERQAMLLRQKFPVLAAELDQPLHTTSLPVNQPPLHHAKESAGHILRNMPVRHWLERQLSRSPWTARQLQRLKVRLR